MLTTIPMTLAAALSATALAMQTAPTSQPARTAQTATKVVDPNTSELPAVPATPAAITTLVDLREFHLAQPYEHRFSKEKQSVTAGYLIVVRAPSEYLAPRQVEMPVLMVGTTPVEPMNVGFASGQLVAIVPSPVDAQGKLTLDLAKTPIYFAPPALPETIDLEFAKKQLALAERSGILATDANVLAAAKTVGGATVELANREALDLLAGSLVRRYAADEVEVADALEGKIDSTPRPAK